MKYLIDTNIISELMKASPSPAVTQFLLKIPSTSLYLSALSWGELRKGVEKLSLSSKKAKLTLWLENDFKSWFGNRVLPFDANTAELWGKLLAEKNRPVAIIDSLIASTALYHQATLITRNTKDFDYPDLVIINPFEYCNE